MTDVAGTAPEQISERKGRSLGDLVRATEIDLRLFGMVAALALILIGFGIATGGRFLEPVNLLTLSVQGASVAIIATGMVLVIVSRNIDLSVGSLVGVIGMSLRRADGRCLPEHDRASTIRSAGSSPSRSGSASARSSAGCRASSSPTSESRPSS